MLGITHARLRQSDRDGMPGVFLRAIARLLAGKAALQTAMQLFFCKFPESGFGLL